MRGRKQIALSKLSQNSLTFLDQVLRNKALLFAITFYIHIFYQDLFLAG